MLDLDGAVSGACEEEAVLMHGGTHHRTAVASQQVLFTAAHHTQCLFFTAICAICSLLLQVLATCTSTQQLQHSLQQPFHRSGMNTEALQRSWGIAVGI